MSLAAALASMMSLAAAPLMSLARFSEIGARLPSRTARGRHDHGQRSGGRAPGKAEARALLAKRREGGREAEGGREGGRPGERERVTRNLGAVTRTPRHESRGPQLA